MWEPIYAIAEGERFPPAALYAIAAAFSGGEPLRLIARALWRAARQEVALLAGKFRRRGSAARQERKRAQRRG